MSTKKLLAAAALIGCAANANAYLSEVTFDSIDGVTASVNTTTNFIDFTDGPNATVTSSFGAFFSSLVNGSSVTFFDFTYENPISQTIWSSGTYSFMLENITEVIESSSGRSVLVAGTGTAFNGGASSDGFFEISLTGSTSAFSFDAFTAVPEPASLALLGLGLAGLGVARRKQK